MTAFNLILMRSHTTPRLKPCSAKPRGKPSTTANSFNYYDANGPHFYYPAYLKGYS
jgi:hypothetical protein